MKNRLLLSVLLSALCTLAATAALTTVEVPSRFVPSPAKAVVAAPDNVPPGHRLPALYLLHGYQGDRTNWSKHIDLDSLANLYGVVIVCPDGYNLWYRDTPKSVHPKALMESYITDELVTAIDNLYPTDRTPRARAVAGLSMGGHGALWLGGRHPELFGVIGSMSGALDLASPAIRDKAALPAVLGPYKDNSEEYRRASARTVIPALRFGGQQLLIDCGTEDFLFTDNEAFHLALNDAGVKHTYVTRPGKHDWAFWTASLPHFLEFFKAAREPFAKP